MRNMRPEAAVIFAATALFFLYFLFNPLAVLLMNSFNTGFGVGLANYISVLNNSDITLALSNSLGISLASALISTFMAFMLAYSVNCTRIAEPIKSAIRTGVLLPMLLPTITYGFAIIYSFGKQGFITRLLGREIIEIYGFNGLLMGYVIYTLPSAFLLINSAFGYMDKKFIIISKLMGDGFLRSFFNTVIRPLIGAIGGAFVMSFVLSFTDFGIPASVGGSYSVIATYLYQAMLGAIPDFNSGSVIAVLMLIPAAFGVLLLNYLERFNFHYDKLSNTELPGNSFRDIALGSASMLVVLGIMAVFLVMFITPFVKSFPYDMSFTTEFFTATLSSGGILYVFGNSLIVSIFSAVFGTIVAYGAALVNTRTNADKSLRLSTDVFSMITNTVPGMVLGLSYLVFFNGSSLKGTFAIIIICNIIHFFTTPYLMAKNSLSKLNPAWEITGELMGDKWINTIARVIVPNSASTMLDMVSYFFINSMITISAIIFLVTARTAVVTSKIKELQHFANFNEVFVLSILIFFTNISFRIISGYFNKKLSSNQ